MINEVLFEHVAPSFDNIEQGLFEWPSINLEPVVKDLYSLYILHLLVDLLVRVNLSKHTSTVTNTSHTKLTTQQQT